MIDASLVLLVLVIGCVVLLIVRPGKFRLTFRAGDKTGSVNYHPEMPRRNDK